jgi:hypothetical protein
MQDAVAEATIAPIAQGNTSMEARVFNRFRPGRMDHIQTPADCYNNRGRHWPHRRDAIPMKSIAPEVLRPFARKYVWWKTPDEALAFPQRIVAQVMNLGDYEDVQVLATSLGESVLRDVLLHAEAGQFNARSWHYWHYRLDLAAPGRVPPLPARRLG